MKYAFELKNITYLDILHIPSLKIPLSQVTCLVGESGSGKTTLLKLLNNLIRVTQGEIFYKEKNITEIEPVKLRRRVVMSPQVPVIFPGTIKDNLEIALTFSEKPLLTTDHYLTLLHLVHLPKNLNDGAQQLSGGEKQRLALARVLLLNPEVLLLDEPSSALDEKTEELVIDSLVQYVKTNNKTLVMITHSTQLAEKYAGMIVKLKAGRVL